MIVSFTRDLRGFTTWYANGRSVIQGVEANTKFIPGGGVNLYGNATNGSAKYVATGLWIQNAPRDIESLGL